MILSKTIAGISPSQLPEHKNPIAAPWADTLRPLQPPQSRETFGVCVFSRIQWKGSPDAPPEQRGVAQVPVSQAACLGHLPHPPRPPGCCGTEHMCSESLFTVKVVHSQGCSQSRLQRWTLAGKPASLRTPRWGNSNLLWLQGASGPRAGARLGSQRRGCVVPCPVGDTRRVTDSLGSVSPTGNGRGWISCSGRPLSFLSPHHPLFQENYRVGEARGLQEP